MKKKIISLILCVVMCASMLPALFSCGGTNGGDDKALVIMTDILDGLFNPFYATSGNDTTIVSMTQIGMLTTGLDENGDVIPAFGDDEAVVVKDYESKYDDAANETTYTFVIKNGIKYSDGQPLTIEDVLFNMYVYLDPVYTGSSTMYSTKIKGLADYRTQQFNANEDTDNDINESARNRANARIQELINVFKQTAETASGSYDTTQAEMEEAIKNWGLSSGYLDAVATPDQQNTVTYESLLADYHKTLQYFKEELESDYDSAKDSYTDEPYKSFDGDGDGKGDFDEITSFMYAEGFVTIEWGEKDGKPNADKSVIKKITKEYSTDVVNSKEAAINHVYNATINSKLDQILLYWATSQKLTTEYMAKAREVILRENMDDGELLVKNIEGIKSLGHTGNQTSITVNGTEYAIATTHNDDGTPAVEGQYDILQITIEGIDPKAVWNFAFAVAPQHYYAEGNVVDIANNKFGVKYASFDFMTNEIQSQRNVTLPMGAGAYKVTNSQNSDTPTGSEFFQNNVVYFKANENFLLGTPKIEKVRYQVVSSSNALQALEAGSVHFVTPQLTTDNEAKLEALKNSGFESLQSKQLGYGYIGINAAKIPNIYLRKAIMAAMDTSRAITYYSTGTAERIFWPMSTVSWAYPMDTDASGNKTPSQTNNHDYPYLRFNIDTDGDGKEDAINPEVYENVKSYMAEAATHNNGYTDSDLEITFTIAGSNLTEHPTYQVFQMAAQILNECGWNVTVIADSQALTKISTGSLSVWAAAWGTTVDPDMYQVYHKNSTASSTKAWGYNAILADPEVTYWQESAILDDLSQVIDEARETDDRAKRTELYEKAMGYVLDLAVELPVYQRNELYAYNANVIKSESLPSEINPYTSPIDKLWEIEFNENYSTDNSGLPTIVIVIIAIVAVLAIGAVIFFVVIPADKRKALFAGKKQLAYTAPVEVVTETPAENTEAPTPEKAEEETKDDQENN